MPHLYFEVAVYQSYCKRTFCCTTLWLCVKSVGLLAVVSASQYENKDTFFRKYYSLIIIFL